jgi:hypothetical protein
MLIESHWEALGGLRDGGSLLIGRRGKQHETTHVHDSTRQLRCYSPAKQIRPDPDRDKRTSRCQAAPVEIARFGMGGGRT